MKFFKSLDIKNVLTGGVLSLLSFFLIILLFPLNSFPDDCSDGKIWVPVYYTNSGCLDLETNFCSGYSGEFVNGETYAKTIDNETQKTLYEQGESTAPAHCYGCRCDVDVYWTPESLTKKYYACVEKSIADFDTSNWTTTHGSCDTGDLDENGHHIWHGCTITMRMDWYVLHQEGEPCSVECNTNYVWNENNNSCECGLSETVDVVSGCQYIENCEYVDYQFKVDKRVEVDCEKRDSHGRPLVKLILQERKWRPGWTDELYRWDNDISSCMSNQVIGKAIEVWEYGDCGGGAPKPDIYRGTFTYPDQMDMYLGKGKCNYYLKVDWDDPDLWWFNSINFSAECGDCILRDPSEEGPPPVE